MIVKLHVAAYRPSLEFTMLPDASVCFDSMSGKCVTGGSVAMVISLSSCSF